MFSKSVKLNNGVEVPQLALGTWLIDDNDVCKAVKSALALGYRHVDTAQAYGNERGVGEAVRNCGVKRSELFITSKVAAEHKTYKASKESIDKTLTDMQLDYLDMMIIHSPQPWNKVNQCEDRYYEGNLEAWRALEDAYRGGKLRAIGVSNFIQCDIDNLIENAQIKPMVNQVLCHISNSPLGLIDWCQKREIVMEAYSPVAHGEALKNASIAEMAQKYSVTVAQLCLRFDIQLGMIVLPKTENTDHMKNNADLDFIISEHDMETLKNIERIKDYGSSSFFPVYGGRL